MNADLVTDLLNKTQALVEAKIVTYAQVAKEAKIPTQTLYQWFGNDRRNRPGGLGAVHLMTWLEKKTLQIAMPEKRHDAACYRAAYNRICQTFPVNGRKNT